MVILYGCRIVIVTLYLILQKVTQQDPYLNIKYTWINTKAKLEIIMTTTTKCSIQGCRLADKLSEVHQ